MQLDLNRDSGTTLTRQIYEQIRFQILNGDLKAGEKLPSSRELASGLTVSRIVVVEAYELLIAEGFLTGLTGSGTYIASGAFLESSPALNSTSPVSLSTTIESEKNIIDFRSGIPALDLLPRKKWAELTHQLWLEAPESLFSYDSPAGRYELREVISGYLKKTRAVVSHPEQILITSGSVQGLVLVAQSLLTTPGIVLVEDPANRDIRQIFAAHGGTVLPVPVDEYGIQTQLLPHTLKPVLIQVTPSHQFPLGGNLPIQRRIELIQYARDAGSYIIEDDYDSEFRYEGPPISSLQSLEPERAIYLGTFSKCLFPAFRIGYIVIPWALVAKFRNLKRLSDMHTNSLNQLVLTHFIKDGHFERHILKMKKVYRQRRDALIQSLLFHFPDRVKISGQTTGLHLIAEFDGIEFNEEIIKQTQKMGVGVYPVEIHSLQKKNHLRKLILGYGHLNIAEIEEGVKRLKEALTS